MALAGRYVGIASMHRPILLALSALVLLSEAGQSLAAPVQVVATGTLDVLEDPDGYLPFSAPLGTPVTMIVTYDDASTDPISARNDLASYALGSLTMIVGDAEITWPLPNSISIENDFLWQGVTEDLWGPISVGNVGPVEHFMYMKLSSSCTCAGPTALTSDALVPPPWPSTWDYAAMSYLVDENTGPTSSVQRAYASASIQAITVVPGPPAAWLLGTGLLALTGRRLTPFRRANDPR